MELPQIRTLFSADIDSNAGASWSRHGPTSRFWNPS
jgi:hypothetical protein